MALVPHYFNGTCTLQSLLQGPFPRIPVLGTNMNSCSHSSRGQILHNGDVVGEVCSSCMNERSATGSNRHQSLREQLRLLDLEPLSNRALLRSTPAPRKLEDDERHASNRHLNIFKERTRESLRSAVSTSVGQLLRLLTRVKESEKGVMSVLEGWECSLSPREVVMVLNSLHSWKVALFFFKWLQAHEYSDLNIYTFNVMLKVLRRGRQWKLAEGIAEDMIRGSVLPDNITYSTIISCANRCNYQDDAVKWYQRMHEAGCTPDEVTYSSMIDAYGKSGRFNEAVVLYEHLRGAGWKPDRVTFGTMIKIYGRAGNASQAVLVFREMKEAGIKPDSVVYNTLICLLARLGRNNYALHFFEEMERTGVKPNAITLSTLIDAYSGAGNPQEGLKSFARLKQEGVVCDVIVYNTMIKMCGEAGLIAEADCLFKEMVAIGCRPTDWTYKIMITSYAKCGMVIEAEQMFLRLRKAGYEADVMAYTALLQAYGIAKEYRRIFKIIEEMVEAKCNPDDRLCGLVLNLLSHCDRPEGQGILRKCLRIVNSALDSIVGQLLEEEININNLKVDLQCLLREVPEDAHKPFCNSLLDLSWKKGNRNQSFQVLSLLSILGVYPGLQSKSSILWSLHLRSLSVSAAQCALLSWLSYIKFSAHEGRGLPDRIHIETGAGRKRGSDGPRLNAVISTLLRDLRSPFKESVGRGDCLVAPGADVSLWLGTEELDLPMNVQVLL